jgi:putative transposase
MIEPGYGGLSVAAQCTLIGLAESSYYYTPCEESEANLHLMSLMDKQYLRTPFYGVERMKWHLRRLGYTVNGKRVRRLLRLMGIEAIYPKRNLSQAESGHKVYPYLLRNKVIERPVQVWSTDITYIGLARGYAYLTAVIDWYSRYVLAWSLSNTMEASWCAETLRHALRQGTPEIFNTDQGSQFTSAEFVGVLESASIAVSMDGRGRATDNAFVERLWRSVKYEDVYLRSYQTMREAQEGLTRYFKFYNQERVHLALGGKTPKEVHFS